MSETASPSGSQEPKKDVNIYGDNVAGDKVGGDKVAGDKIVNYINKGEEPAIFVGVPTMPNHFVGREALIEALTEQLISGNSLALSAEGLPGVGKTTMAVALAHRQAVLTHFKDGVLWAGLGPKADATDILNEWAYGLGADISHLETVQQRHEAIKGLIGQRRMLLVVDDAWEPEAAQAMRCGGPNCCHLLTTRNKDIGRDFAGAGQTRPVPTLEREVAFELLQALAPEACAANPELARKLAQAVDGLPLALELLGGYLAPRRRSLTKTLTEASLEKLNDPAERLRLAATRLGGDGQRVTLTQTIGLTLESLRETEAGEEAVAAFYALGAFAPKPTLFSMEAATTVAETTEEVIATLEGVNLVEFDDEQLMIHQTLAEFAAARMDEEAVSRHRAYYLELVNQNREAWQHILPIYKQLKWAWRQAPEDENLLEMLWALRLYRERQGLWQDSLAWYERALAFVQENKLKRDEATILNNMGSVYDNLGQREEALRYYNKALPIREEVGDRAGQATTLNNMGMVYNRLGQREEALRYYNKALPIREEVGDRSGLAATLNNIGNVYNRLGQLEEALKYYNKALPISKRVGNRNGLATTLHNMGSVYRKLKQQVEALRYYNEVLPIRKEVGDQRGLAATLNNIGNVYKDMGQREEALQHYDEALSIREEVEDRSGQAATLNSMGAVYSSLGLREEALRYYNEALSIVEEVGERYGESITRWNIAKVYRSQERLEEAVAELRQSVALSRFVQSPYLETILALLAEVEAELGRKKK